MFCSYHVGWRLGGGSWLLTVYLRKRGESKDMICTCKVKIAWYVKEKKRNYIQKLRSCENVITGAINQRRVRLKALQRFCSNHAFHHGYHRGWLRGGELLTVYLRKQRGNTDIYTCNLSISLKFQQPLISINNGYCWWNGGERLNWNENGDLIKSMIKWERLK